MGGGGRGGRTNILIHYISGGTDTNKDILYYILHIIYTYIKDRGGKTHHFQNRDGQTHTHRFGFLIEIKSNNKFPLPVLDWVGVLEQVRGTNRCVNLSKY